MQARLDAQRTRDADAIRERVDVEPGDGDARPIAIAQRDRVPVEKSIAEVDAGLGLRARIKTDRAGDLVAEIGLCVRAAGPRRDCRDRQERDASGEASHARARSKARATGGGTRSALARP